MNNNNIILNYQLNQYLHFMEYIFKNIQDIYIIPDYI
jgi:hypothetical protein